MEGGTESLEQGRMQSDISFENIVLTSVRRMDGNEQRKGETCAEAMAEVWGRHGGDAGQGDGGQGSLLVLFWGGRQIGKLGCLSGSGHLA